MTRSLENVPPFFVEGPCPSDAKELQYCVLRFICGSPSLGPLPTSAVGLNAALRRAYQKAGHALSSLSIFKAGNTGNAIRSIQSDLQAKRCGSALTLDDSSGSDDLLILDVDRHRLHNVLLAPLMVNGDGKQPAPAMAEPVPGQASVNKSFAHALLRASGGAVEGTSRNRSRQRKRNSQKSNTQSPADVDDELMQLLAEPTVKRKDWEPQGTNPEAENGQPELNLGERAPENNRYSGPSKGSPSSNSSSRSSKNRSSSSSSGVSSVERRGHKRRRRRRRKRYVANHSADRLVFTPDGPDGGSVVLRPEDQPKEKKKVAEVPLFQWVSANAVSDLKTSNLHSRGRGRSRSRDRAAHGDPTVKPEKLSGEDWEQHRSKSGMKLVGETRMDLPWVYLVADESRRSFTGFLRNRLSAADAGDYFERIRRETDWKQPDGPMGMLPRKTCWMVSKGCACPYRYGGIEVAPQEYPPWMLELQKVVMPLCGFQEADSWPNSCNLNLYADGGMSVGWHSDDERLFQGKFADCSIISLSLGARRKFELRLNWPEESERSCWQLILGDGDILTMEGMAQKHYQHRVPREDGIDAPRINLTWRWVAKHSPQCPVERHRRH